MKLHDAITEWLNSPHLCNLIVKREGQWETVLLPTPHNDPLNDEMIINVSDVFAEWKVVKVMEEACSLCDGRGCNECLGIPSYFFGV